MNDDLIDSIRYGFMAQPVRKLRWYQRLWAWIKSKFRRQSHNEKARGVARHNRIKKRVADLYKRHNTK